MRFTWTGTDATSDQLGGMRLWTAALGPVIYAGSRYNTRSRSDTRRHYTHYLHRAVRTQSANELCVVADRFGKANAAHNCTRSICTIAPQSANELCVVADRFGKANAAVCASPALSLLWHNCTRSICTIAPQPANELCVVADRFGKANAAVRASPALSVL
ncbi:hypothetical protein J6590_024028 [Homalodisca vitripennis]|nr:hypothetical protein J6590_024028 [Homalodisca vitripennis]